MKKILGVVLTLVMLVTMTGVLTTTMAASSVKFTIDTLEKQGGETIPAGTTFDLAVRVNAVPEICAMELKMCYNKSQLKAVSATKEGLLTKLDYATATVNPADPVMGGTTYGEVWLTGMGLNSQATTEGEVLSTITFEAVADITANTLVFVCADPVASNDPSGNAKLAVTYADGGVKFSATTTTLPNATNKAVSLMPENASAFQTKEGGNGTMTVSELADGKFKFTADQGWPQAFFSEPVEENWVTVDTTDSNAKLYWDFTVSASANVLVFFEGQDPSAQSGEGTYVSINTLIDPANLNPDGTIDDLPAGNYKDSIEVSKLGCAESLMTNGKFRISGVKVFAVGGTVVVNDLSADGESAKKVTTTTAPETTTTEVGETTTTVSGETTATVKGETTTTVKRVEDTSKNDAPKTADVSDALLFVLIGGLAAAAIVMTVSMKKSAGC